ncbi:hypothetical protein ACHAPA_010850 [Fusarium lateritium]
MRFFALINILATAAALPTEIASNDLGSAVDVAGRNDVASLGLRVAVPEPDLKSAHVIETREVKSFPWPESSFATGNSAYQVLVTSLGSNQYRISFYNSSPKNGWSYRYTVTAVGPGGNGLIAEKVLTPQTPSEHIEVEKSGDTVKVEVVQA